MERAQIHIRSPLLRTQRPILYIIHYKLYTIYCTLYITLIPPNIASWGLRVVVVGVWIYRTLFGQTAYEQGFCAIKEHGLTARDNINAFHQRTTSFLPSLRRIMPARGAESGRPERS